MTLTNDPSESSFKTEVVCLPSGTYTPFACGGTWAEEVSWEVHVNEVSGGATAACNGPPPGATNFTLGAAEDGYSSRFVYLRGTESQKLSIDFKNLSIDHFGYSDSSLLGGAIYASNLTRLTMQDVRNKKCLVEFFVSSQLICMLQVSFSSNHGGKGGGLYITSSTSVLLASCNFVNNIGEVYFGFL